jgi:50S ribosomal protein L16 3-hydroxylase
MSFTGVETAATAWPWNDVWRRKPTVIRQALSAQVLEPFRFDQIGRLFDGPTSARLFLLDGPGRDIGRARLAPSPRRAFEIYKEFRETEALTLLANGMELTDPRLVAIQDSLRVPFDWRRDDIVMSVSTAGAGIGFHGGREDGFVVQVDGARRWRVWGPEVISEDQRRFLLGDDRFEPKPQPRPAKEPLIDCILEPGDVLYTPAMFAHEGETVRESVSLSLAWAGVSAWHALAAIRDIETLELPEDAERSLLILIPDVEDPDVRGPEVCSFLAKRFEPLGVAAPSEAEISELVARLLRQSGRRRSET